jgi:hypothetical protein
VGRGAAPQLFPVTHETVSLSVTWLSVYYGNNGTIEKVIFRDKSRHYARFKRLGAPCTAARV